MSGTRADARKRRETDHGWSAVLYLDGQAVTGQIPCDEYDAASIASPLVASWLGGPVSVAHAVAGVRRDRESELTLFEEAAR